MLTRMLKVFTIKNLIKRFTTATTDPQQELDFLSYYCAPVVKPTKFLKASSMGTIIRMYARDDQTKEIYNSIKRARENNFIIEYASEVKRLIN
jgi:hypothetical protein